MVFYCSLSIPFTQVWATESLQDGLDSNREEPSSNKRKLSHSIESTLKTKLKKARNRLQQQETARSELLETAERLDQVENELLYEFVGWDAQIKRLMAAARVIILQPEIIKKPVVVPLIGFPGYGKTTLIQRWLTKMKWGHRFTQINLKKNTSSLPTEDLVAAGELEGEKKEEIQQVILYDEIQNLMRHDELYPENEGAELRLASKEDEQNNHAYAARVAKLQNIDTQRQKREKDHLLLWNILGNGTLISESKHKPDEYLELFNSIKIRYVMEVEKSTSANKAKDELSQTLEQVQHSVKHKEEIQKDLKNKMSDLNQQLSKDSEHQDPETIDSKKNLKKDLDKIRDELSTLRNQVYKLDDKIDTLKEKISSAEKSMINLKERELVRLFASHKQDFPAMLGLRSYVPDKQLAEDFLNNPDEFLAFMQESRKGIQKDKTSYFHRVIIIITGNPEDAIRRVTDTFSEIPESEIDPDSLRQRIMELLPADEMQNWFRSIFGSRAGLESRLRLSAWEFILPFSVSQWEELIERNLTHLNDSLSRDLRGMGIHTALFFDQSIHQMLYKEGVNPLQGPRGFFDVSAEVFGSFVTKLKLDLISMPKQSIPRQISISFNNQTGQLEARSENSALNIDFRIGLKKRQKNQTNHNQSLKENRNFIHHVAYCLAGTYFFKKFPRSFSYRSSDKNEYVADLWPAEDVGNLFYKKNLLYTLLAAYAADLEYFPAFSQSGHGRNFKTLGKEHLNSIKKDLAEKRKNLELSKPGLLSLKHITPELADDNFFKLVDEGKLDEALLFALSEVRDLLNAQKKLMRKIAQELNQKRELNANELARIFLESNSTTLSKWNLLGINQAGQFSTSDEMFDLIFGQGAEPMEVEPMEVEDSQFSFDNEDGMELD